MRATDEMVRSALTWARSYEEIGSFGLIAPAGRKWRVGLASSVVVGSGLWPGPDRPQDMVPDELVLTNREALAFAYGCAVAGARHGRAEFAREKWGWQ
jgi:hypothetical protein